jgi:probable F420-dependent oxidoreductase
MNGRPRPREVAVAALPPVRAGVCAEPDWMVGFARHAERLGFESVVVVEHPLVIGAYESRYPYAPSGRMPLPDDCRIPDPLDTLAFIAGATTTVGLATGVLVLPAHHPVVLAKRLATVDVLSKGRLRLTIGVGWLREELEACGTDFDTRGRRADESIDVLRALWADDRPNGARFDGEFFHFDNAHSHPKPHSSSGIPIHVGGHSAASIRRAARRGDGWHPLGLAGDDLHAALRHLRWEAESAGRDPDALEITLSALATTTTAESLDKAAALGACRLVAGVTARGLTAACDELSALAERIELAPSSTRDNR